jgi:hypothetical protein
VRGHRFIKAQGSIKFPVGIEFFDKFRYGEHTGKYIEKVMKTREAIAN